MSEAPDVGSTETQADPKPEPLTVHDAARRLAQARQEKRQALSQAAPEPQPAQSVENAEPVEAPATTEPAEAEAIDFEKIDFAEVAAPLGVERDQDQTTGDDAPAQSFTLKHNGQEQTVTQAEAIDLAQMGLDYRKKTQSLADDRRSFEGEREAFQTQMKGLQEDRERLAAQLQKFTDTVQPPDPALADTDIDEFNIQMAKYQAHQLQAQEAAKELDAQRERDSQERQKQAERAYNAHMQRLHTRVPDMAKREVAHAVGRYLTEGLQFSGDELIKGMIAPADSRFQEMAYKAMMHDAQRAKAKQLRPSPPSTSTGGQRSGVQSTAPKLSEKDRRNPRKVADFLKQRKAR